jgi:hypothetical protein
VKLIPRAHKPAHAGLCQQPVWDSVEIRSAFHICRQEGGNGKQRNVVRTQLLVADGSPATSVLQYTYQPAASYIAFPFAGSLSHFNVLYFGQLDTTWQSGMRLEQIKLNANVIGSPITRDCYVTRPPMAVLFMSILRSAWVERYPLRIFRGTLA